MFISQTNNAVNLLTQLSLQLEQLSITTWMYMAHSERNQNKDFNTGAKYQAQPPY